jgi:threonylcarbamoyladenosine tRNA methylthiotransferase MtaB
MKTVKFYTLGCKVNQYETQAIREQFLNAGFKELSNSQPADIYVINTCTVTHRADSDSFNLIRRAKRENSKAEIIAVGCLTELDEDKIKNIDREILIIKNKDKNKIIERLNIKQLITHNSQHITYFKGHTRAFLKIQDGCNNFCSYCKVPLVRGASRSRPLDEIIQEASKLVKNGFQEIVLSGICLGAYGRDLSSLLNLVDVIEALENIEGLLRIRLSSIEAGDVQDALIQKIAKSKKLCRHLHIPIQSGDDEILKKMNRSYTKDDYLNLIKNIKNRIPEMAITTDVMVGFPGETEENFQNTLNLIKEILPLRTHIFPYSPREGTLAFNLKDKINSETAKERILYLKDIAKECSISYRKQFLNKNIDVLIETKLRDNKGHWQGYADNYIKVLVNSGLCLKNQLIPLRLKKIFKDCVLADFA